MKSKGFWLSSTVNRDEPRKQVLKAQSRVAIVARPSIFLFQRNQSRLLALSHQKVSEPQEPEACLQPRALGMRRERPPRDLEDSFPSPLPHRPPEWASGIAPTDVWRSISAMRHPNLKPQKSYLNLPDFSRTPWAGLLQEVSSRGDTMTILLIPETTSSPFRPHARLQKQLSTLFQTISCDTRSDQLLLRNRG